MTIHTEADYKATLQAVSALMESDPEPVEAIKLLDLRAQEEARALRGKISWDGDLNAARSDG